MSSKNTLYIAGREIVVPSDQVVALTRQVSEVARPELRQSNLSNTFRVPHVFKNELHLNFAGRPGSTSKYPYRFLPCRLSQGNIEVVRDGTAVINSSDGTATDLTIYWGNSNFFDRLNFKLSELNLTDLNHTYSVASVVGLGIAKGYEIFYPFMDFSNGAVYTINQGGEVFNVLNIQKAYPALSMKSILQRIVDRIGFTLEGNILNDTGFNNACFVLTERKAVMPNVENLFVKSQDNTGISQQVQIYYYKHAQVIKDIQGNSFPSGPSGVLDTAAYVNRTGIKARFKFKQVLNHDFGNAGIAGLTYIFVVGRQIVTPGGAIGVEILYQQTLADSFNSPQTFEYELEMFPNSRFFTYVKTSTGANRITIKPGSTFETISIEKDLESGDAFPVAANMPNITAYEFLRILFNMHGLIFDSKNRHVFLYQFKDIERSKTDKKPLPFPIIERSINSQFNPGRYYRENIVKYEEGLTEGSSEATFTVDNNILPLVGEVIKIDAYLPGSYQVEGIGQLTIVRLFDEEQQQQKIGLPVIGRQIRFVAGVDQPGTKYGYSMGDKNVTPSLSITQTSELAWATLEGVTPAALITEHYTSLINILQEYKKYTVEALINESQFMAIDHFQAYYVKELMCYIYIEKAENFVPGKNTKLTFIKI